MQNFIEAHVLGSVFMVFIQKGLSQDDCNLAVDVLGRFHKLAMEGAIAIQNTMKTAYLSVCFGIMYNGLLGFDEIEQFSLDLSYRDSEFAENYFWYLVTMWPNNSDQAQSPRYNEDQLVHCVRKLTELAKKGSWISQGRRRFHDQHAIFFLTNQKGLERVIQADSIGGRNPNSASRLKGTIVSDSIRA